MNRLILILVLFLTVNIASAADKEPKEIPEKKQRTAEEKALTEHNNKVKERAPEWPRPYKSTEQISADSVVPFPTDI